MKYGGGRPPKNRWSDKLSDYKVGDAMRAEWQYVPTGWFPEQLASTKYYLIIKKAILWHADNGVEWDVVNLETGQIYKKMMLNQTLENGRAIFFKLSSDELKQKLDVMPKLEESREWWPK
jgi:hypothetical protein